MHHNEKYAERCKKKKKKNLMGRLETYNQEKSSRDQEGKNVNYQ